MPRALVRPLGHRLLIVGLRAGLRGANRPGALHRRLCRPICSMTRHPARLRTRDLSGSSDDGLELWIPGSPTACAAFRPQNKPLPSRSRRCRTFLTHEIAAMTPPARDRRAGPHRPRHRREVLGAGRARSHRHRGSHMIWESSAVSSYHCRATTRTPEVLTPDRCFARCSPTAGLSRRHRLEQASTFSASLVRRENRVEHLHDDTRVYDHGGPEQRSCRPP